MKRIFLLLSLTVVANSVFSIDPSREYTLRPEAYQLTYEEVKIRTVDDSLLNAWIMPPASEKKQDFTFILAGSDAGNMGFLLAYAFFLVKEGYTVVTFDYRGFGESSDFEHNPDFLYHHEYITDCVSVINWTKASIKPKKIGVLAFSMGTLIAAASYREAPYDLLVTEGFIANPKLNIKSIKKRKGQEIFLPKEGLDYKRRLKSLDIPVLLIAGTQDKHTTLADSARFARKKRNRRLLTFEGEHLKGAAVLGFQTYVEEIGKAVGRSQSSDH